jgi:hypothetical protein
MNLVFAQCLAACLLLSAFPVFSKPVKAALSACAECHKKGNPGLFLQWEKSAHGKNSIDCQDCHGAEKTDIDAFLHHGVFIATLVTPKDCGQCHADEEKQASQSHHAKAGEILESQDAFLAEVAAGHPAAVSGCENCHGGKVTIDTTQTNKLSVQSWPNSGIGRLNPDGSKGSCNACHSRHSFSVAQARNPDNCGKCHLGPDHPQKEIYEESKHGIAFQAHKSEMNLGKKSWKVGVDYYQAPTCASCHMSATAKQPVTHDVGDRISWTLRPAISVKQENWPAKRDKMKEVCSACHEPNFVNGHYAQFDALTMLYNERFAKPAGEIYAKITKKGLRKNETQFGNPIDWTYYELWHHEGRRARMGAAMMGPDYTWWHGMYEVSQNFYFKLIPEAQGYNDKDVSAFIDSLLKKDDMHTWLGKTTADLKADIRSGKLPARYKSYYESK